MNLFKIDSDAKKEVFKYTYIVIISVFLSAIVSFIIIANHSSTQADDKQQYQEVERVTEKTLIYDTELFADIVEEISPSIVHITTKTEHEMTHAPGQFFFEDEIFRKFFGFDHFEFHTPPMKRETTSAGSGTIITSDGYILTNYHVIRNASEITVKIKNDKEYKAKLAGKDQYSDLAVIKIDEKDLSYAKLSDSSKVRPGQWAIAVGSPHGLDYTVTLGIISAMSRDIPELSNVSFIQTDAAINPGNSGGPLLNINGEVVGINTAIMGTAQNIGFAIPINTAKKIVEQLKAGKPIGHPWLGIAMSPITEELTKAIGIPDDTKGVLISKVMPNSPADVHGLQAGDVIQKIDGKKFDTPKEIQKEIKNKKVNDTVHIQIIRDGEILGKKVKLGNWGDPES